MLVNPVPSVQAGTPSKFAVTAWSASIVGAQLDPVQSPAQLRKREPASGVAVNVTGVPTAKP